MEEDESEEDEVGSVEPFTARLKNSRALANLSVTESSPQIKERMCYI